MSVASRNRSRGLLRSSERLSSAEIRMLESGLRVDVSIWTIEAVVAMMKGYKDAVKDAVGRVAHVPIE
jgi:hypothetical protein